MNPLVHRLPDALSVDGQDVKVDTSHRRWLQVARLLDSDIDNSTLPILLRLLDIPYVDDTEGFIKQISWFLSAGDDRPRKKSKRVMCWDQDAARIVSSFQVAYGIDLTDTSMTMHWFRFMYLFSGLPSDTEIMQAIKWRSTPQPKGKHVEQEKKQWRAMQKYYKLYPKTKAEAAALADKEF